MSTITETETVTRSKNAWDHVDREAGIAVRLRPIPGTNMEKYEFLMQQPDGPALAGSMWAGYSGWKLSAHDAVELLAGGTLFGEPTSKGGTVYEAALLVREIVRRPPAAVGASAQNPVRAASSPDSASAILEMALPMRDRATQQLIGFVIAQSAEARIRDLTVFTRQAVQTEAGERLTRDLTLTQIVQMREGRSVRVVTSTHELTFRMDGMEPRRDGKGFVAKVASSCRTLSAKLEQVADMAESLAAKKPERSVGRSRR